MNHLLHPYDIEGIEVYTSNAMPAMFRTGVDECCGVIAIWTRRGT